MQKIHEFMKWKSMEPRVYRITKELMELNINPIYVFHAIFEENQDIETVFNELVPPMGQQSTMGQPQMPANPNTQQIQQMGTFIGNFMKQKTGNAGFDNAISNLGQQIKLMQQKKQPGQQPQPTVPNQQVGQQQTMQQQPQQQPQQ